MASVACDSPIRRFAAKQNKENSPVELNRLKTLLKKKVGDDGTASGSSASPKKAATPRKEVKIKRGATVKLCTSCVDHNKEVEVEIDGVKRTRRNSVGQDRSSVNDATKTVEKKTAVKKPREMKKKDGAQSEMLDDMPSTSGTAPSTTKATAPTDSGNQAEGESKPKRQRKKVDTAVQHADSTVEKVRQLRNRSKVKDVIKVKVAQPRKIAKKMPADAEKAPFENMDVTNLVNSTNHGDETMQNAVDKSNYKRILRKKNKEMVVHFENPSATIDSMTHKNATSGDPSQKKSKNEHSTKSKIPRLKQTSKKAAENETASFENMDVTDLVNSTSQQGETNEKSDSGTEKKTKKTTTVSNPSTNTNDNPIGLPSSGNYEMQVENSEDMFASQSLINSQTEKEPMNISSSIDAGEKDESTATNSKVNVSTQGDSSTNRDMSIDTMLNHDAHNPLDEVLSDFNLDASDNHIPIQAIEVSTGENINLSASTNLSRDDITEGIPMNLSGDNSLGKNSTLTINSGVFNNIENTSAHSGIHHDETFPRENLPNDTIEKLHENVINVTLRAKKVRKNKKNVSSAQNTSSDGVISFTQNDPNRVMTDSPFNENDKIFFDQNQQPSEATVERWTLKSEPADHHDRDHEVNNSKSVANPVSPVPSDSRGNGNLTQKSGKPASKAAKTKEMSNTSKDEESTEKKKKSSKKNESLKKASKEPAEKLVVPSPPKSKKKSKDDETLCEKHKYVEKCDEKSARRSEKKRRMSKQLKNDLKVAKAIEGMSHHFSKISIGTTIGTINELHIGLPSDSDSDSSSECSTCGEFSSESSGDHCQCYRCLRKAEQDESSDEWDDDDSSNDSSSTDSSSCSRSTSSSSSSSEEIRRPMKKPETCRKKIVKPTYKEKLSEFCSKYDLRSNNMSRYDLRSHKH